MPHVDSSARPFWWDTASLEPAPSAPLPPRVDVAVVGGGITGLCAALALAKRGATVAVLEAKFLGWGASSRNAGMVLTGLKLGADTLIARYGRHLGRQLFDASLESVRCVAGIVAAEGIECDFVCCGHLSLAAKASHVRGLADSAAATAREFGHESRVLSRAELAAEIGTNAYHGAVLDAASAGVNPARYVAGLVRAAARAGVMLVERTPVTRIERRAAEFELSTPAATLVARDVLIATSGYTSQVTAALQRRIVPIGSYIIVTEPLAEDVANALSPRGRMMYDSWHFLHYFRLTPDRRFLFGGRAGFVPETDAAVRRSERILRRDMIRLFPMLADARVEYVWGGTLDFPFDLMPHAGVLDGCHYALGYAGHGVAFATYLGTRMGEALAGRGLDDIPFAALPFPGAPLGLYRKRAWFLPLVAGGYRFLDWIS